MGKLKTSKAQVPTFSTTRKTRSTKKQESSEKNQSQSKGKEVDIEIQVELPKADELADIFSMQKQIVENNNNNRQMGDNSLYLTPQKQKKSGVGSQSLVVKEEESRQRVAQLTQSPANLHSCREYLQQFDTYINDSQFWPQPPVEGQQLNIKYQLIEDIAILYFVSSTNPTDTIDMVFWDYLVSNDIFYRSASSLRNRYRKYLIYLTQQDIFSIATFLLTNSIQAHLDFTTAYDGSKKLNKIVSLNSSKNYKFAKWTGTQSTFIIENYKQLEMSAKTLQRHGISPGELFGNIYSENSNFQEIKDIPFKKVKLQIDPQKESGMQLEFFRKEFGLDKDTVLDKLESVSGEWMDLLALLTHSHQEKALVWTHREDTLLANTQPSHQLHRLLPHKSTTRIRQRQLFLGINKP